LEKARVLKCLTVDISSRRYIRICVYMYRERDRKRERERRPGCSSVWMLISAGKYVYVCMYVCMYIYIYIYIYR
jgi:hypothetical protein